jgi:pimeloyl-ACP methyl ester carboxylesterase
LTQELRFARTPSGSRLGWARTGRGPLLIRAAHWMTHLEHDLRSAVWRPWIERIGRDVTLIRYDARGFGISSREPSPIDLPTALEDLETVVGAVGAERFTLLGISSGRPPRSRMRWRTRNACPIS